ncbi:MAG: DNA polymerase III subunit alpha [Anaerolineaceae bacterium]|nr:DNA polymerase III subunit alpha [Anaerolineaceae bacterium]
MTVPYLRTHSYFGFLESLLSPQTLVSAAQKQGITCLGLTDHRFLTGSIEFYEACNAAGIKPILGLEVDLDYEGYSGRFALLAKDRSGWSNLCRLSSALLVDQHPLTPQTLADHAEGLIGIAGSPRGILRDLVLSSPPTENQPQRFLTLLQTAFKDNLYIEIQRYANGPLQGEALVRDLAEECQIPLLATQDIYYQSPEEEKLYRTLTAIRHITPLQGLSDRLLPPGPAAFPEPSDFQYRYRDCPEAINNLSILADRCNLDLPIGGTLFPTFPTPQNQSQAEYLREKAVMGAKAIYGKLMPEITNRLDYELEIITRMGYEPIFLIVQDVLNHARQVGIPTSSRGSAASSLVAHCLNITSPDPLALNLYFERFLNPARKKPPDIDTDIASHRRDELIQYIFESYGRDKVAMVGTINRYRPKSALGDVAKAYGLSPDTIRQLSRKLPHSFRIRQSQEDGDPFAPLLREGINPLIQDVISDARALLDLPRHLSVHPGGVIIAPFPITDLVPLEHSNTLGINHAQYDLEGIEKLGLVKIDMLGIRGLTVLGEVANKIQSWRLSEFQNGLEVLSSIPLEDAATSQTVEQARTIGCFQIESPGMRGTLREIQAHTMEDIMAALALYRPGPLRGGLRDAFVRRFRGEEEVTPIHSSLNELLKSTYGVILYQEQVLRIAHELGGLTIAQADILRRAMSHFDPGGVMVTLKKNFIHGAGERHHVPEETAERIWEMMAAFAGYGFPKAHAASYAQLAWNSAWCKTHYPAEFMAAVLGYGGGYYSQRVYLMEARRLKLPLHPPHVNHSDAHFRVIYPKGEAHLYMGLGQVRDLTQRTIQAILQNRPYQSLEDFLLRVDPQQREARNLIMVGALNGIITIPEGLRRIEHKRPPGQMQLFGASEVVEDWDEKERQQAQQDLLGVSLGISPLEQITDEIQASGAITTLEAQDHVNEKVTLAGMRQTWRRLRTQNSGQMLCFLNLEDLEGSIQVLVPPVLYARVYNELREIGPFLVEGVVKHDPDRHQTHLVAEKIQLVRI